jgi:hypothetical protein
MTRAAISADIGEAELQPLLDRLCDTKAEVVYFPVRHHSPAGAALVGDLIGQLRPSAVLIEGPSDFNDRIDELLLEHELPIAIYSYFRGEGEHSGAYYPLCEYSPEWSALHRARRSGIPARFIDLPWAEVAHYSHSTQRYADAELKRGRYVRKLCDRMHVEDFDDLWDAIVESREPLSLDDYLQHAHSLCFHIRVWDETIGLEDRRREAFMAEQIRTARRDAAGPLLVVTGGFHSSALAARLEGARCPGTDDDEPVGEAAQDVRAPAIEERGIALTTYSYERLDNLTGYNAGMPNPGFYEHAWRQRRAGRGFSHQPLLIDLVRELRKRKQTLSTADLIAVETSARALAALRGRGHVWRRDLIDAVTSALIKDELEYGCRSAFVDAVHAVLRGERRGKLAQGTRMPPLVEDIRRQLAEARFEISRNGVTVTLDLLKPDDLPTSRLLHRLKVLGIAGVERTGGTNFLERDDLARLWESWQLRWSPEFEATCIEASRYGTSLADAVASRLSEMASAFDRDATAAAALLVQAARTGVETISTTLIDRLGELIREESLFVGAAGALGHILFLFCHDEAFGTNRLPRIGQLLSEAFARSLWLLELLGRSAGNEAVLLRGLKTLLETSQRTADSPGTIGCDRAEFIAVLTRVERDSHKPASVRGASAGILWTLGAADEEQILSDLMIFATPSDLGDFLSGLFALARETAQRHAKLVRTIDHLLMEFGADDFQASLPSLRLAFTYFTPREKHHMLTTLFESLGLKEVRPLAALAVNEAAAAEALAFEERLFEMIGKYGLEQSHE